MAKEYLSLIAALIIFLFLWFRENENKKENFYNPAPYCHYCHQNHHGRHHPNNDQNKCDTQNAQFTTDGQTVINPSYLNENNQTDAYAYAVINRQKNQIQRLRDQVKDLAYRVDDLGGNGSFRKKLTNKYYQPKPFLAHSHANKGLLNLNDDDFSNKTLSTIKFLSHTRASKFYGDEIHFPSELCGSFCSNNSTILHDQIDTLRPIQPANFIPRITR